MIRLRTLALTLAALSLTALLSCPLLACWAALSTEQMVTQSALIVHGKLSDKKEGEKGSATATLTIARVFKGDATLKQVTVSDCTTRGTASFTFAGNEDGIWFLKAAEKNTYTAFHPSCVERTESLNPEALKKRLDALAADVKAAQPVAAKLGDVIQQAKKGQLKARVYEVEGTFEKQTTTTRTNGQEFKQDQWFLKSDSGEKAGVAPGALQAQAEESAKSGTKVGLIVIPSANESTVFLQVMAAKAGGAAKP